MTGSRSVRRKIRALIEMVGANAIALHLNYLEESVQPEGQTRALGPRHRDPQARSA